MKRKKKTTRPKNRAESESKLIQAAKEVFSEHGYDRATTRMVAQKSGVNLGLIQRYFGNKHGLLIAVIDHEAKDAYSKPLPYPEQETLLKECLCYAEAKFRSHVEHTELMRIIVVQLLTNPEFSETVRAKHLIESRTNILERIRNFFMANEEDKAQDVVEQLERSILSSVVIGFFMAAESKEKCLKDLLHSVTLIGKSFNKHAV